MFARMGLETYAAARWMTVAFVVMISAGSMEPRGHGSQEATAEELS